MAGEANTTSPSAGVLAWKCSARSRDLANAGPFNRQVHSIGPTLFYNFGGDDDEAKGGDDEGKAESGDDSSKASNPSAMAVSMQPRTLR